MNMQQGFSRRAAALRRALGRETTGGLLTLVAAVVGLVLANSPARSGFVEAGSAVPFPSVPGLDLSVADWAQDGLLAVFFFMVGMELAQEFTVGSLRDPRRAAAPVCAAVGGMIVPALLYVMVVHIGGNGDLAHGWAVPTATDVAFASMVLALFGKGLPAALRTFLLTLAVVDDLLGIVVIAFFYSEGIRILPLLGAVAAIVVFAVLIRVKRPRWWVLVPVALAAWVLLHASGVHPTIAGAALGLSVPARPRVAGEPALATLLDLAVRPFVNGLALPVFALFAAGVPLLTAGGDEAAGAVPAVAIAVALGLVVGKPLGVLTTTWVLTKLTPIRLPDAIGVRDLAPVGALTGIGFTVSLLIAGLSFADEGPVDTARGAVLVASLVSAIIGAVLLRRDAGLARGRDMNEDGAPDTDARTIS